MNYTNKDFYARISRIEDLNFSVRREAELHLGRKNPSTRDKQCSVSGIANNGCNQMSVAEFSRVDQITSASLNLRESSVAHRNAGSTAKVSKSNNTTGNSSENSYVIVAVTEGRGHAEGEIGLAAMNVNSPSLILSQISDAFSYHDVLLKLQIFNPSELIMPLTVYNAGSKLLDEIKTHFPSVIITPVPRRHFTSNGIKDLLNSLATSSCKDVLAVIEKKFYALSAATGLLAYVKNILLLNFLPNSLKIQYQSRTSRMFIDFESYHRLELLYSLAETKEKRSSLYGFLNNTVTSVGSRCLRASILEPFCEPQQIYDTQNCIRELLDDQDLLFATHEALKRFSCCDQLVKLCILPPEDNKIKSIETMLNQVLLLKSTLENLPHLRDVLNCYKSEIFVDISNILKDPRFDQMLTEIKKVIQPEVQSIKATTQCFQRIYAIKSGICEYLDFMRTIYSNLIEVMRGTVSDLAVKLGLPLRMIYAVSKGFHMQLTFSSKNPRISIPSGLDIIYQRGNNYYLTNPDLYKLNVRVSDVIDELHLASYRIARNLVENLLSNADANYELVGAVSKLDIILSLAKASARSGYCCPKFGRETRVVGAIYPFLEYTSSKPMPVPNNIIGTPDYNFYIITGPNMGGKTLYIKTIAVLQIMAQLGCYVPAQDAIFRICDRIFTRIGFEEKVENDSSSYVKEMKEFQYIFAKITPNSLVFIDEICRNTNPEEGKLIALKICKSLASVGIQQINQANKKTNEKKSEQNTNLLDATLPFIYLTTHFLELTKSADDFLNISNLFLHAEQNVVEDKLHLTYTHRVMEGVTPIRGYGLALARTVRFPPGVIERAEKIYQQLLTNDKDNLQTENGFPRRNTSHPIIVNLEESIRNITQPMHHQTAPLLKTVPSFLNKSVPNGSQNDSSCLENKSGLLELNAEFYDVFAQIASTLRDKLPECQEKCKDLVENFIKRQPAELLDAIYQIKKQDFDDLTSCSICNAETISGDKSTFTIERTNLLDLSFHSLVRRLGCDDSKDTLRTLPCTPSAASNLNEFYRYTPLTDIRSYISVTPLIESIASGYAQTCPVNTHNKLSAGTYEIETGHLTFPMRRRAFNFQNSNYPKATQSNSDCNSSVLQLQELVRDANATPTNETSQSFQPLSYDESVASQDQIKKIGNLSFQDFDSSYSNAENHNPGKLQKVHLRYGKKSRTIWRKI